MRPLYARALRLRRTNPSGLLCFAYFEGAVILAVLLAFAERVTWWGVLILPALIAVWVKFYDVVAGVTERRRVVQRSRAASAAAGRRAVARHYAQATAPNVHPPPNVSPADRVRSDSDALRASQSASRRYPPFP